MVARCFNAVLDKISENSLQVNTVVLEPKIGEWRRDYLDTLAISDLPKVQNGLL
jgi:hypothetical protein